MRGDRGCVGHRGQTATCRLCGGRGRLGPTAPWGPRAGHLRAPKDPRRRSLAPRRHRFIPAVFVDFNRSSPRGPVRSTFAARALTGPPAPPAGSACDGRLPHVRVGCACRILLTTQDLGVLCLARAAESISTRADRPLRHLSLESITAIGGQCSANRLQLLTAKNPQRSTCSEQESTIARIFHPSQPNLLGSLTRKSRLVS